jgi:hypothetical protein
VEIALATWPKQSSRTIAEWCGVSHILVQTAKQQVVNSSTSTVTGSDGKTYPATRTARQVFADAEKEAKEEQEPTEEATLIPLPAECHSAPPGRRRNDERRLGAWK